MYDGQHDSVTHLNYFVGQSAIHFICNRKYTLGRLISRYRNSIHEGVRSQCVKRQDASVLQLSTPHCVVCLPIFLQLCLSTFQRHSDTGHGLVASIRTTTFARQSHPPGWSPSKCSAPKPRRLSTAVTSVSVCTTGVNPHKALIFSIL